MGYLLLNCLENLAGGHWINSWFLNKGIGTVTGFPMDFGFQDGCFKDQISGIRLLLRARIRFRQDKDLFFGIGSGFYRTGSII